MFDDNKSWLRSRTIVSGILAAIGGVTVMGVQIDLVTGEFHGNLWELLAGAAGVAGGAGAIWGRFKATTRIGG